MKKKDIIKNMEELKSNKVKIEAASSWISNSTQYHKANFNLIV